MGEQGTILSFIDTILETYGTVASVLLGGVLGLSDVDKKILGAIFFVIITCTIFYFFREILSISLSRATFLPEESREKFSKLFALLFATVTVFTIGAFAYLLTIAIIVALMVLVYLGYILLLFVFELVLSPVIEEDKRRWLSIIAAFIIFVIARFFLIPGYEQTLSEISKMTSPPPFPFSAIQEFLMSYLLWIIIALIIVDIFFREWIKEKAGRLTEKGGRFFRSILYGARERLKNIRKREEKLFRKVDNLMNKFESGSATPEDLKEISKILSEILRLLNIEEGLIQKYRLHGLREAIKDVQIDEKMKQLLTEILVEYKKIKDDLEKRIYDHRKIINILKLYENLKRLEKEHKHVFNELIKAINRYIQNLKMQERG